MLRQLDKKNCSNPGEVNFSWVTIKLDPAPYGYKTAENFCKIFDGTVMLWDGDTRQQAFTALISLQQNNYNGMKSDSVKFCKFVWPCFVAVFIIESCDSFCMIFRSTILGCREVESLLSPQ